MPIDIDACLDGRNLTEPCLSPDGAHLAYVVTDSDDARVHIVALADHLPVAISPWSVRAGRSLGGGCFAWCPDGHGIVVVTEDAGLCLWRFDGSNDVLIDVDHSAGIGAPSVSPDGMSVAFHVDHAEIHVVDMSSKIGERIDHADHAFVMDPVWRHDAVIWQAWSPPHMPWDESRLMSRDGVVQERSSTQFQQPRTSLRGDRFGWLDDARGWLNVVVDGWGRVEDVHEHGGPNWGDRQTSWCFNDEGTHIAFTRNEDGFGRLSTVDLSTGRIVDRARAVHGQLSWVGTTLAAIRTGARTPTSVVVYDTGGEQWTRTVIDTGPSSVWNDHAACVEPTLLRVTAPDDQHTELHARLYRSPEPTGRLLCWIHGGPTDQWQVTFLPRFVYWLDRGYDILVPDHRGSTGHGRAYAQALHGGWGDIDVQDVQAILSYAYTTFGYVSHRTAVLGSSAGGLTALCLLAQHPDCAAVGVVAYPVSDIAALDRGTHRFEAHYNRSLVGDPAETVLLSRRRSPVALVETLCNVPLLIFHGDTDPVVPIDQSDRLVRDLRARGADVEYIVFDGEGHGFRRRENKIAEYVRTEEFLRRHL